MDIQQTEIDIKMVLAEVAGIEESRFNKDTTISRELGIDSLKAMELLATIETKYGIRIEEEKVLNVETVGEFIDLIKDHLSESKGRHLHG